jgi:hypothetical protein
MTEPTPMASSTPAPPKETPNPSPTATPTLIPTPAGTPTPVIQRFIQNFKLSPTSSSSDSVLRIALDIGKANTCSPFTCYCRVPTISRCACCGSTTAEERCSMPARCTTATGRATRYFTPVTSPNSLLRESVE